MSAQLVVQVLGWVAVGWLLVVHLLVERGRLAPGGTPVRLAGSAAGAAIVATAAVSRSWPLIALGLFWLRTEVFAHRHPIRDWSQAVAPRAVRAERPDAGLDLLFGPQNSGPNHSDPAWASGPAAGRAAATEPIRTLAAEPATPAVPHPRHRQSAGLQPEHPPLPHPHLPHPHLPQMHLPHPHLPHVPPGSVLARRGRAVLATLFKIEIIVIVVILLVVLAGWARKHNGNFGQGSDHTVCLFRPDKCNP